MFGHARSKLSFSWPSTRRELDRVDPLHRLVTPRISEGAIPESRCERVGFRMNRSSKPCARRKSAHRWSTFAAS